MDGKAHFIFDTENMKNVPGVPWFPDGRRLQVEADVIEKTSGKKESAIDNGIYFVKSPYKIHHKETAEYFKPALPFVVKVPSYITNYKLYYRINVYLYKLYSMSMNRGFNSKAY